VIVDDMVSSGHTLLETLARVGEAGLAPAICIAVHGIFADGADRMLLAAGAARVVTCNTIGHATNAIDVAPAVADELARAIDGPQPAD
jgi:ribose-phosphate pyrophosphokinase